jgi:hypothetical protein
MSWSKRSHDSHCVAKKELQTLLEPRCAPVANKLFQDSNNQKFDTKSTLKKLNCSVTDSHV